MIWAFKRVNTIFTSGFPRSNVFVSQVELRSELGTGCCRMRLWVAVSVRRCVVTAAIPTPVRDMARYYRNFRHISNVQVLLDYWTLWYLMVNTWCNISVLYNKRVWSLMLSSGIFRGLKTISAITINNPLFCSRVPQLVLILIILYLSSINSDNHFLVSD